MIRLQPLRALSLSALIAALASPFAASAHFLELIPSTEIVTSEVGPKVTLELRFTHPMERGPVMDMGEPLRFGVLGPEGQEDLAANLTGQEIEGSRAYRADYRVKRPGDHVFFVEPAPYWEPAEGVMIVHYTKVVVGAFGAEGDWDAEIGLPVEITPLVRPYGLWTGNLFRGVVKQGGKPVAFAEVEVEWRNDGTLSPPAVPFITQVIKADSQGVFSYAIPRAGWWGFAALLAGDTPMKNPAGETVPLEAGALIWVRVRDMQ